MADYIKQRKDYSPQELFDILSQSVIGQKEYLEKLAVTVWLHNKRLQAINNAFVTLNLQKHNLLCIGPTGCGKTLAVSILAKLYDLDVLISDASQLTGTGWKGMDANDIIRDLYSACREDRTRTEKAIVVLDEIDKMALQGMNRNDSFCAEHSLLKLIEGTDATFEYNKRDITIDTRNILFIGAGAFEGIDERVKRRTERKQLGFTVAPTLERISEHELYKHITKEDLKAYGMGMQLLGRFSDLAILHKLDAVDLRTILLESKASVVLNLNDTLLYSCGLRVEIDTAGADAVAEQAVREGTGARGLAQIIMPVIHDTLFIIDNDENISGILLTAQNGVPWIKLREGKRQNIQLSGMKEIEFKYTFPHPIEKNVEHFSWHILSVHLNKQLQSYDIAHTMHIGLCSMVFYVLECCNDDDWTFESLQKLVKTNYSCNENEETVYDVLIEDEMRKSVVERKTRKCVQYYWKYQKLDHAKKVIPMLQAAIDAFVRGKGFIKV